MSLDTTGIRINGKDLQVPSVRVCGCTVVATGRWLKTASIFDEELIEAKSRPEPHTLVELIQRGPLRADLLTFGIAYCDREVDPAFQCEPDNIAVACTESFEGWWNSLPQATRRNVRLSEKRGVVVRPVEFDESLVAGIKEIYDETPVRQGRPFWHYRKDLSRVWAENATYLPRSRFVGAFVEDVLVGFIKYIWVDQTAVLIQILGREANRDQKPANALLKCAIELCEKQGLKSLVYGKFDYGAGADSSLTEFKRRNGFIEKRFFRYLVPLSVKGRIAIQAGLHHGLRGVMPAPMVSAIRNARARVLDTSRRLRSPQLP